jgi:hypothetical protein
MSTTTPALTGDRCRCTSCGRRFTSRHSFDKHRVLVTAAPRYMRRCMDESELAALGMVPNAAGFLRIPMSEGDRIRRSSHVTAKE